MTKPERVPLNYLLESPRGRKNLERFARAACRGAIFIYPTETIYGLGGAYGVCGVRERMQSIKRRPPTQPFILVAPERSYFNELPVIFTSQAEILAQTFWPGTLTLVLPSPIDVQGVGVRVSDHAFIKEFLRLVDKPFFSTSANLSGKAYVNDPNAIWSTFSGDIDFFVDAGPLPQSNPSTVVRVEIDGTIGILREGAISSREIVMALQQKKG